MADIKVWMLTGDKGETAQNIAISCGLIDPVLHSVIKIKNSDLGDLQNQIDSAYDKIKANIPSDLKVSSIQKQINSVLDSIEMKPVQ